MKILSLCILLLSSLSARADEAQVSAAPFAISQDIQDKIIAQGVPRASLLRILDWMAGKHGTISAQRVYNCKDKEETNYRPCAMRDRTYFTKEVKIKPHRFAVSVNFTQPSTEKRFYMIDLLTGEVNQQYVSHGKGSGKGVMAEKFSNILNSSMTSLGTYLVGEVYKGSHGETLRMYGLEATNDAAYHRDIVFHSASYADEAFFKKIDPKTGQPYTRLGLSDGCPAISPKAMKVYLPLLREAGIIDHHHDAFTP